MSGERRPSEEAFEAGTVTGRRQWPLWLLALFGLLASVLTLVLLSAAFAWLQLGTIFVKDLETRPDQDLLFGILRNAVTAGAALGVGMTLVLSYRRQKTLEENQTTTANALLISSKAQETASDALELSNKQHQLEVDRRTYDQIKDLRERYAAAASQLGNDSATVRMAGVYVMATLADEWHRQDHDDQRQACIDVLCSYYRAEPKDEDRKDLDWPVKEAIWRSIISRLRQDSDETRWSSTRIDLRDVQQAPSQITGIKQDSSLIDLSGSRFTAGLSVTTCVLESGHLNMRRISVAQPGLIFRNVLFRGGRITLDFRKEESSIIQFVGCRFTGGRLELLEMAGSRVEFIDCQFNGGELDFSRMFGALKVKFVDSVFTVDVVKEIDGSGFGYRTMEQIEVVVRGCEFEGTSTPFSGHKAPASRAGLHKGSREVLEE